MSVVTAREFATQHNLDYQLANSFLRMLVEVNKASVQGTRPTGGRGRGSYVYDVPDTVTLDLTGSLTSTKIVEDVEAVEAVEAGPVLDEAPEAVEAGPVLDEAPKDVAEAA